MATIVLDLLLELPPINATALEVTDALAQTHRFEHAQHSRFRYVYVVRGQMAPGIYQAEFIPSRAPTQKIVSQPMMVSPEASADVSFTLTFTAPFHAEVTVALMPIGQVPLPAPQVPSAPAEAQPSEASAQPAEAAT